MRRLPIFILLDTSGSMRGEPVAAMTAGLQSLISSLKHDPYALETVYLAIITFDREARLILPFTELAKCRLPQLDAPLTSPTNLGEALEMLCQLYEREVVKASPSQKGDWLPMAIVMTDGAPSDTLLFDQMVERIRHYSFSRIVACAAGPKARKEPLQRFATDIVVLDTMDSNGFTQFWQWVSGSISRQSARPSCLVPREQGEWPAPPPEISIARG